MAKLCLEKKKGNVWVAKLYLEEKKDKVWVAKLCLVERKVWRRDSASWAPSCCTSKCLELQVGILR